MFTFKEMKLDPYLTQETELTPNKSDIIVRSSIIKLIEENISARHCDLGFGNDFLNMTSTAQMAKEKNR